MPQDLESGAEATHGPNPPPIDRSHAHLPGQPSTQPTHPEKTFSDPSGPLFSMYLERAEEEDKKMVENWKGDAEGILVFTGLFSATVATFLGITFPGLQLNSQDASAFYLSRIYQQSVSDSGSQLPIPSTIPDPATFSPSTTTVWVNALWFLSLVISLTCALLATMLQQWARHYLRVTQTRYQPHKRARIRTFYFQGVEKFRVSWAIDALPALLHLSVFLFYAGLSVLLFSVNLTVFKVVVSWVALCASLYAAITMMPAIFPNSPYRTPLSTLCWTASLYILRLSANVLKHILDTLAEKFDILEPSWTYFYNLGIDLQELVTSGMLKTAEKTAMKQPPDVDGWALTWTWDSLDEDHELEEFLAGVPGFLSSKAMEEPGQVLMRMDEFGDHDGRILDKALGLMCRPVGPSVLSDAAQFRRFKICCEAVFALLYHASVFPSFLLLLELVSPLRTTLDQMAKASDQDIASSANCITHLVTLWSYDAFPFLDFIRHVACPYFDEPPRTMSTKAITSTLRHFVRRQPSLIDCDIWNQVVTKTPDQDRNEIASHILASLSWGYRSHHLRAPGPSSAQFWNAETYEELITLDRSSFPLCTEADHRRPVHPIPSTSTSSFDTQHARQLQRESALQFPRVARPGLSISISTPPHTPAVPAAAATTETGESPTSDAASTSTPVPSAALSSSAQEAHHSAALALTVPSSTAIVSLSIDRVDASGSAQSADAPSAVDTAPDGPIGRPSSDSLQLHGVVAAAAGIVSVDL